MSSQTNHNSSPGELAVCRNCSNTFAGNFCNLCGEKAFNEHDKSFAHFLHETFHFLTHLDGKFLRSLRYVFTKPGFLSGEITNGVRRRYFPPLNLFLIGVVLYLLFPMLQGLNMPLQLHLHQPYSGLIKPLVAWKLQSYEDFNSLASAYQNASPKIAKLLLLIVLPLTGWILVILFPKRKKYFFDHLTLAAEINTFYLFLTFFIIPILHTVVIGVIRLFNPNFFHNLNDRITFPLYVFLLIIYSYLAFRRFYTENKFSALYKSILFLILHGLAVYFIYKAILAIIILIFI